MIDTFTLKTEMRMKQRQVGAQEKSVTGAVRVGREIKAEDASSLWGKP